MVGLAMWSPECSANRRWSPTGRQHPCCHRLEEGFSGHGENAPWSKNFWQEDGVERTVLKGFTARKSEWKWGVLEARNWSFEVQWIVRRERWNGITSGSSENRVGPSSGQCSALSPERWWLWGMVPEAPQQVGQVCCAKLTWAGALLVPWQLLCSSPYRHESEVSNPYLNSQHAFSWRDFFLQKYIYTRIIHKKKTS